MTLDSTQPTEDNDDIYESRSEEDDYGSDMNIEDDNDDDIDSDWE